MNFRVFSTALWFLSALFVLSVAIMAAAGQLAVFPLIGRMLSAPHIAERIAPFLILLLFTWVLVELAIRKWRIDLERAAIGIFTHELASTMPEQYTPMTANSARPPRALRRLDLIMECKARGDAPSLHEGIPTAAALDTGALNAPYVPLHVYAWILPVLGFIGTASGMAAAIGGFKDALSGGTTLIEAELAKRLSQEVIPGLSAAFETTILALAAALVAYLCTSALKNWDQELLHRLDELCAAHLLSIPLPFTRNEQEVLAALDKISQQLDSVAQLPVTLENAANAMGMAATALASASGESASAAGANRSAAEALAAASKELRESAAADYQFTLRRTPRQ